MIWIINLDYFFLLSSEKNKHLSLTLTVALKFVRWGWGLCLIHGYKSFIAGHCIAMRQSMLLTCEYHDLNKQSMSWLRICFASAIHQQHFRKVSRNSQERYCADVVETMQTSLWVCGIKLSKTEVKAMHSDASTCTLSSSSAYLNYCIVII